MSFSTPLIMSLNSLYVLPITKDMNLTRSAYIMTSTIISVTAIFATPVLGKRITSKNLKLMQTHATLIMAMAYASYGLAKNVIHLYLASFLIGTTFMIAGLIPISIVISNWFVKKRGFAMSIVVSGISVGGFLLSPLITYLILHVGWRMSRFYVAVLFVAIVLPVIWKLIKCNPEEKGLKPYGADEDSNENYSGLNAPSIRKKYEVVDLSLKQSQTRSFFYLFMFGILSTGIICGAGLQHFNPYVSDIHGSIFAGTIVSVYAFSGIFGKVILGWINDRFGSNQSMMFGGVILSTSFLLISLYGHKKELLLMAAVLFGFGVSIGSVNVNLLPFSVFGTTYYGEVLSLSKGIQQFGMALGPLILAFFYDSTGSYKIAWLICSLIALITILVIFISDCISREIRREMALEIFKSI
ncbi:MAG: MFS transporter [Bacillota bacterium]|nr:MFS transporter [Bacillota bacterium]